MVKFSIPVEGDYMRTPLSMSVIALVFAFTLFSMIYPNSTLAQDSENVSEKRYYFTGTVGPGNKVQMDLVFDGEDVNGSYYYDKRGIPLSLSGSYDKESSVLTISEKGGKGLVSGTFKGKVVSDGRDFAKSIKGEWSNQAGDKKLPFKLTKVSDFESSKVTEGDKIEAFVLYPEFLSPDAGIQTINTELSNSMKAARDKFIKEAKGYVEKGEVTAGCQQDRSFGIAFYSDSLISLIGEVYEFTGGAHGNTNFMSSNYAIKEGRASLLKLSDLFEPGSDYIKAISKYCMDELLVKRAGWVVNGELTSLSEKDLSVFALSPEGIKFAFAPYAVGSYAEGPYFVTVPFNELRSMIDPGGPLAIFLK